MTRTFDDEEARRRDALYQALQPQRNMSLAMAMDRSAELWPDLADRCRDIRDATLLRLAIRALTARQRATP